MSNPALRTDAVNDVASFTGAPAINAGTSPYVWWFKGTVRQAPSGLCGFVGTSSSASSSGFVTNANLQLLVYSSGSLRYSTPSNFFIVGESHHYRLEHDAGGAWRAYRDDLTTPVASGSYSTSQSFATLNQMFRSSSGSSMFLAADVEEMGLQSGAFSEVWQAALSGGTGNILPTVSGNNNATLINFPTDNSQWINFAPAFTELQAAGQAIAAGVAALTTAIMLAAAGAGIATGTANLTTAIPLQASGSAVASGTANLTADSSSLAANGQAVASGSAQLTTQIQLQVSGTAQASGTADLTTQIRLQASGSAVASGTANLQAGTTELSASGQAVASGYAQLTTRIDLAASGAVTAAGTANLSTGIGLRASGSATPAGTANLATEIWLVAYGQASASGTAVLGDVGTGYLPDPDRLTFVTKENRISAVWGEQRLTAVDRHSRLMAPRGKS